MYQRRTHNRSQRFGGHTRHAHYCACGRVVYGNGSWRHFHNEDGTRRDGHRSITQRVWSERFQQS